MNSCETKLEDYTLKDVKRICEQTINCKTCPFCSNDNPCMFTDVLYPEDWSL